MRVVRDKRLVLRAGLSLDHWRAQHDVAVKRRAIIVHECQDVRRVVPSAVAPVERAPFATVDEAQNTTPEQMKMFLTRIGFGTQAVITGDITQIDLARGQKSGLIEAERVLKGVRGIAFVRFTSADVVRHPLVQKIIDAYERDDNK